MKKKNKSNKFVILGIIYFVILLTISTAYSFFNTDLSINATVGIGSNTKKIGNSDQYKTEYILQNKWQDGNAYYYHYVVTLTYLGNDYNTSWKLFINVPYDTEVVGCYNASTCTVTGENMVVINAAYNGLLNPNNNSVTFSYQIKTNNSNYDFSDVGASFYTYDGVKDYGDVPTISDQSTTQVDYINPSLKITGGWGNISTYVLKVNNTSSNTTLNSWSAELKFPPNSSINSLWGGEYQYDAGTGLLTIHGPEWSYSLYPNSSVEVNIYMDTNNPSPFKPELGSFTAVTTDGTKVSTNMNIEGDNS